jgi:hypothetical protein
VKRYNEVCEHRERWGRGTLWILPSWGKHGASFFKPWQNLNDCHGNSRMNPQVSKSPNPNPLPRGEGTRGTRTIALRGERGQGGTSSWPREATVDMVRTKGPVIRFLPTLQQLFDLFEYVIRFGIRHMLCNDSLGLGIASFVQVRGAFREPRIVSGAIQ